MFFTRNRFFRLQLPQVAKVLVLSVRLPLRTLAMLIGYNWLYIFKNHNSLFCK
jgi:hypothetical protein